MTSFHYSSPGKNSSWKLASAAGEEKRRPFNSGACSSDPVLEGEQESQETTNDTFLNLPVGLFWRADGVPLPRERMFFCESGRKNTGSKKKGNSDQKITFTQTHWCVPV